MYDVLDSRHVDVVKNYHIFRLHGTLEIRTVALDVPGKPGVSPDCNLAVCLRVCHANSL